MDNCCEYISQDGEVKHVLQFFCECEDLDETFTNFVFPPGGGASVSGRTDPAWQRLLAVAQDRARVPWPGGARRVDLAWLLAAALLLLLRWHSRRSKSLVAVGITLAVCFGGLAYSHVLALRRRSNSQFHMAWLTLSIVGSYWRYRDVIGHTLPWTVNCAAHAMLVAMAGCYLHCCVRDPGRDPIANNFVLGPAGRATDADVDVETLREQRWRSEMLRSGRCSICRSTFRLRDHHCVWVGQCVAERNRRQFLLFLVLFSGLCLWFGGKLLALSAWAVDACHGHAIEKLLAPGPVDCLVRLNFGGYDVAHALYACLAGVLAAGLALQQILLVGAGVTSLELRRNKPAARSRRQAACSPDRSRPAQPYHLDASSATQTRRTNRVKICPPARDVCANWARFLTGTELAGALSKSPVVPAVARGRPLVETEPRRGPHRQQETQRRTINMKISTCR